MSKVIYTIVLLFFIIDLHAQQVATSGGLKFNSFTADRKVVTEELQKLTDGKFYEHPEYGVLPYNAPCSDCMELLQRRDESHRYFVKQGTNGRRIYMESAYGSLNYYDGKGALRTIDPRLKPAAEEGVFRASCQPFPLEINIPGRVTSLLNAGKELQLNKDIELYIKHSDNTVTSLGAANWSDYTAGDDGVIVHNIYAGIDLELRAGKGHIESLYRLNKPLNINDGWLVIRDHMKIPSGLALDYSYAEERTPQTYTGTLFLKDQSGTPYFFISDPVAYDANKSEESLVELNYTVAPGGAFELYIPAQWMNDPAKTYPLVIDPYVEAMSTLTQANITGSGYNAVCFQSGCAYNLDVHVPGSFVLSDLRISFNYYALGNCSLNKGAWDLRYGDCRDPADDTLFRFCNSVIPGLCITENQTIFNNPPRDSMIKCIPAPQCAPYVMPFTMNFYRCVMAGAGCSFSCITPASDWSMIVAGDSSPAMILTSPHEPVCQGSSVLLKVMDCYGVNPHKVTWYPGGIIGDSIYVTATSYTDTIIAVLTNGAGDTAISSINLWVVDCTGFESYSKNGFSLYPNPANTEVSVSSPYLRDMEESKIIILNVLGQESAIPVLKRQGDAVTADIGKLPPGIYFIKVETGKRSWMGRFVKE